MIRTRDFCLFLLTVLFLVGGISLSAVHGVSVSGGQTAAVIETLGVEVPVADDLAVVVPEQATPDRASLLTHMREKIAALGATIVARSPEPDPEVVATSTASTGGVVLAEGEEPEAAWQCAGQRNVSLPSLLGAQFKEVDGVRVVYRPGTPVAAPTPAGTSTAPAVMSANADVVLLQLPLRTTPLAAPVCIPYDVVGVASDGSLIRNNEQALYAVFGGNTQVGYALDGFPLYGRNDSVVTDRCGGAMVTGQYRYYLSSKREAVLGCFSGIPVAL